MISGWAANEIAELNRNKVDLPKELTRLASLAQFRDLTSEESIKLQEIEDQLDKIWSLEEFKIRQRSRDRDLLEGARNTAYFQPVAKHRSRKKKIDCLVQMGQSMIRKV